MGGEAQEYLVGYCKRTFNTDILKNPLQLGYICGLLAADGCVYGKDNCITLALNREDEETVRYFGRLTLLQEDIYVNYSKNLASIRIYSKVFVDYLDSIGITPRKSKTLNINFDDTFNELTFLLGVIDGDGWISNKEICIYTASELFANQIINKFGGRKYWDKRGLHIISWKSIYAFNLAQKLPVEYSKMWRKTEKILLLRNLRSNSGKRGDKYVLT